MVAPVAEIHLAERLSPKPGRTDGDLFVQKAMLGSDVEVIKLPSGKIVSADSEEGIASKARKSIRAGESQQPVLERLEQSASEDPVVDEVHEMWSKMGISKRAWSQSPPPPPEERRRAAQQSLRV